MSDRRVVETKWVKTNVVRVCDDRCQEHHPHYVSEQVGIITEADIEAHLISLGAAREWRCAVNDQIRDKCAHADWIYATGESKCGPVILWPRAPPRRPRMDSQRNQRRVACQA